MSTWIELRENAEVAHVPARVIGRYESFFRWSCKYSIMECCLGRTMVLVWLVTGKLKRHIYTHSSDGTVVCRSW